MEIIRYKTIVIARVATNAKVIDIDGSTRNYYDCEVCVFNEYVSNHIARACVKASVKNAVAYRIVWKTEKVTAEGETIDNDTFDETSEWFDML